MFIAPDSMKTFPPLGSGHGHFREAMFFLVILRCYKHFAPPERRHQAAKCAKRATA